MARSPGPAGTTPLTLASQLLKALSDSTLQSLAGDQVLARGKAYAATGMVRDLEDLPSTGDHLLGVKATVEGTAPYATELWWLPGDELVGDCDCPQGLDGFFCKHQVALALVWRTQLGGAGLTPNPQADKKKEAAAKRALTQERNLEALREFVFAQKAADLAAQLWQMAQEDKDLMARLKAWQAQSVLQSQLGRGDAKAAQDAIRDLLKNPKGYLAPRDCGPYARRAEQVFPLIEAAFAQSPAQARTLCEEALKRLYKVGETADDSWGGEFSDLVPRMTAWLQRCLRADPPPASWLKTWNGLVEKDPWGLVPGQEVISAAGPAVQKAYSAQVAHAWQEWLAAHPKPQGFWDAERWKRRQAYLQSLVSQGDDATAFEVMRDTASTAREWDELVQWCLAHKREREAFEFTLKAHKLFPQDLEIEKVLVQAYERDGWDDEALALRRRQFERTPSAEHYLALLQAAERAGQARDACRAELMAWAAARETGTETVGFGPNASTRRYTDVSVRVSWLLDAEQDAAAALALVQTPDVRCQADLLKRLALALPQAHSADSAALLQRVLERELQSATSPYRHALALVQAIAARLEPAARRQWLAQLRTQYKAKRNFLKELPDS